MQLEKDARNIFRTALVMHYMDGLPKSGDLISEWLKKHGGWFPDPQEIYGDGTPLTQPVDEGVDIQSPHPNVIYEAGQLLSLLREELQSIKLDCFDERQLLEKIHRWGEVVLELMFTLSK